MINCLKKIVKEILNTRATLGKRIGMTCFNIFFMLTIVKKKKKKIGNVPLSKSTTINTDTVASGIIMESNNRLQN